MTTVYTRTETAKPAAIERFIYELKPARNQWMFGDTEKSPFQPYSSGHAIRILGRGNGHLA